MIFRAFIALALMVAFFVGPAASATCAPHPDCASCCEKSDDGCCGMSQRSGADNDTLPDRALAPIAKSLMTPQLAAVFVFSPCTPPLAAHGSAEMHLAHSPPLLSRTCVRLV